MTVMGIHFPEAKDKMALWCKTLEAAKLEAESQEYLGLILRQKQLGPRGWKIGG